MLHSPDCDFKRLLKWAAMLHECGIAISYKRYRYHSAYLMAQADMAGFDQQEKQMLSALMINHRGKFNTSAYDELDENFIQPLSYLTILLRLAVRIHRGRDLEQPDPLLQIENMNNIVLKFEKNWLKEHPLTRLDLENEAKQLELIGFHLTVE